VAGCQGDLWMDQGSGANAEQGQKFATLLVDEPGHEGTDIREFVLSVGVRRILCSSGAWTC
jgi:hypothetical protein